MNAKGLLEQLPKGPLSFIYFKMFILATTPPNQDLFPLPIVTISAPSSIGTSVDRIK